MRNELQQGMNEFDYLIKLIVVGDSGVGKSCVVMQFIEHNVTETHEITIGVQFASRTLSLGGKSVKFQVWDTAGQENFRSITRSYYRSAIGALLIYDITNFQHLREWIKEIRSSGPSELQILLIGNKIDLEGEREVAVEEGRRFAEENGLQWVEISAKEYSKVEGAFLRLAGGIVKRIENGQIGQGTPGVKVSRQMRIDPLGQRRLRRGCC